MKKIKDFIRQTSEEWDNMSAYDQGGIIFGSIFGLFGILLALAIIFSIVF